MMKNEKDYKCYDEMTVKEKYYLHLGRYLTGYIKNGICYYKVS